MTYHQASYDVPLPFESCERSRPEDDFDGIVGGLLPKIL